jgi:hypothetical protein
VPAAMRDWRTCSRPPPPERARPGREGVERDTRGLNRVRQLLPIATTQQACRAAREERDHGGATDRDRLVTPKAEPERKQVIGAVTDLGS